MLRYSTIEDKNVHNVTFECLPFISLMRRHNRLFIGFYLFAHEDTIEFIATTNNNAIINSLYQIRKKARNFFFARK